MRVGNDVVDLEAADNQPDAIHSRFDARVFSRAERARIGAAGDGFARHRMRWALWAAKESGLKLLRKTRPAQAFHPADFRVELADVPDRGTIAAHGACFDVRLDVDDRRVHAVATAGRPRSIVAMLTPLDAPALPAAASALARDLAAAAVREALGFEPGSAGAAGIVVDTGPASNHRMPRAFHLGRLLPVDVSLSHDGRWIACAAAPHAFP